LHLAELPLPFGRGLIATAPIAPDATLLEVPLAVCFNVPSAVDAGTQALIAALRARKAVVNEDDMLALQLIKERFVLGARSRFRTHIAALPEVVNVPFFFTDEEMAAFHGTNASKMGQLLRADIEKYFAQFQPVVEEMAGKSGLPASEFTLARFKWATAMVFSRFVSLRIGRGVFKTMVPLFDMFNHSPIANVVHEVEAKRGVVRIVTRQGWDAGQQVFLNYGNMSSCRTLWLHGFVWPAAELETFTMQLAVPPHHPEFERRLALIARYSGLVDAPSLAMLAELYRMTQARAASQAAAATSGGEAVAAAGASSAATPAAAASATAETLVMPAGVSATSMAAAAAVLDYSALEMPTPAASAGAMDRWKGHVGSLSRSATDGGLAVEAQLYQGVPHASLLRVLRILHTPPEALPALEAVMASQPDSGVDPEAEAALLRALADSMLRIVQEIGSMAPTEAAAAAELERAHAAGVTAMRAVTARVQAELTAAGRPVAAPLPLTVAEATAADDDGDTGAAPGADKEAVADDDDEGLGPLSVVAGAASAGPVNRKPRTTRGKPGKGRGKVGTTKASKSVGGGASASASAPIVAVTAASSTAAAGAGADTPSGRCSGASSAAEAPAAGAAVAAVPVAASDPDHEYRLQCGAYFRCCEREILSSHVRQLLKDMDALKGIVEEHNAQNARARGEDEEADGRDAAPPAAGGKSAAVSPDAAS